MGNGPALGLLQMEMPTAKDVLFRYVAQKDHEFRNRVQDATLLIEPWLFSDSALEAHLIANLRLQVVLGRIKYYMVPEALPKHGDIQGMAAYWKKHYNTYLGKGTEEEFANNAFELMGR